jgi:hypothetical protein
MNIINRIMKSLINNNLKIIVYSVSTGGYDELRTPIVFDPNIRYILFTDNKYFKSDVWEVNHIDFIDNNLDNRRKARYLKLNPHLVLPNHDISIWIDHCYIPRFNNAQELLTEINFFDTNIMCYKHDVRQCIYSESEEVKSQRLDYYDIINSQMSKYRMEGFPSNYGLFDSGFTIRKNNKNVNKFNEIWWDEVKNFSARDQLSQVYSSWTSGVIITPIPIGMSIYSNKYLNPKIKHPKKWLV